MVCEKIENRAKNGMKSPFLEKKGIVFERKSATVEGEKR